MRNTARLGRWLGYAAWAIAGAIGGALLVASYGGYRLNVTESAPTGIWRVNPITIGQLQRGDAVAFCPPDVDVVREMRAHGFLPPGSCPSGSIPLLKAIIGLPGDTVTIKSSKPMLVNGLPIPNTIQHPNMPPWPAGTYSVGPGEIWVASSYSPNSFDSRYYGPVPTENLLGTAQPVLVKGDVADMVSPDLVKKIVNVESGGHPYALHVNGANLSLKSKSAQEAEALAQKYIQRGYSVDMGLMQVNSRNLPKLGFTVRDMFDPDKNIQAGKQIFAEFHRAASERYHDKHSVLRAALSAYNTGSFTRGIDNGYVAKYTGEPVRLRRIPPQPDPRQATTVVYVRRTGLEPVPKDEKQEVNADEKEEETKPKEEPVEEQTAQPNQWNSIPAPETAIVVGGEKVDRSDNAQHGGLR